MEGFWDGSVVRGGLVGWFRRGGAKMEAVEPRLCRRMIVEMWEEMSGTVRGVGHRGGSERVDDDAISFFPLVLFRDRFSAFGAR